MSVTFKVDNNSIIVFDLDANDILSTASSSPVSSVSKLNTLATQAQLCTSVQCFNCTEVHCTQVQCNQVKCTQVKCSNCTTIQCTNNFSDHRYDSNYSSNDGGRDA